MNDKTDIYKTWIDYQSKRTDIFNDSIAGVEFGGVLDDFHKIVNQYATKYQKEDIFDAVDSQIEWANNVICDVTNVLTKDEIKLLRRVAKTGKYSSLDRELLNELLKKYQYVRKVRIGKI